MEIDKPNSAEGFMSSMADKIGATARAATIFGEPVVRENITIVPVAKARWGFGGGAGRRKDEDGAGGGGGAQVTPVGFIELKNDEAHFRPIRTIPIPLVIAGAFSVLLLLQKALKR